MATSRGSDSHKRPLPMDTDGARVLTASHPNPAKYPRKRVSVACEVCRLRKTRCDAARPKCRFCSNAGIECVYRQTDSGPSPNSKPPDAPSLDSQVSSQDLATLLARVQVLLQARAASTPSDAPLVPTSLPWSINQDATEQQQEPPATTSSAGYDGLEQVNSQPSAQPSPSAVFTESPAAEHSDLPCLVGLSLYGFAKTATKPCPKQLEPLLFDDGEDYLEHEHEYNQRILDPAVYVDIKDVDLSVKACWRNQQSFAKSVLPWVPVFDQQLCAKLVQEVSANGFDSCDPASSLGLFVLALGALSRAGDESSQTSVSETPGLGYFRIASRKLDVAANGQDTVTIAQCFVLKASYLLLCLRTLAAFDAVHVASTIIARQMARKKWLEQETGRFEACHRVYLTCYILEHELRAVIHYGTELHQYERLAMPLFHTHEPGFFWLLSEIALRQIYMNALCGVGSTARVAYAPRVAQELISQLDQWYEHLHPTVKFPLGPEPVLDTQKAFLRAQYYAARFQVNWSYVVQFLTTIDLGVDIDEKSIMLDGAQRAIEYASLVISSAQSLCQDRHLMLFTNLICTFAVAMMLLCIIDVPEFASLHDLTTTVAAIHQARSILSYWAEINPSISVNLGRLDALMRAKGMDMAPLEVACNNLS
ncbi:uncharacterized protein NECHADRAFT_81209 [Fusarium vanettenii 77-13-4]|uniref:Zn(2)-C6 fungal-type domain-containing protein n=1 Tax=Fusarium vanettenii (strain ATCC MYA-4622 / CBS 123669 / FGSC 9596 / NRRL 45880 / 77-13-4) TaxID=660122 RepID=C7ZHP3_FUSV7|nr:uncharacterized protein NECHADRAFT_81209 [Fusarium vanettenii 77-13-4]EEU36450.1 predicted protein [Fusarium vanettenii 77-13-4]